MKTLKERILKAAYNWVKVSYNNPILETYEELLKELLSNAENLTN
jgi:hypothetical protein